MLPAEARAVTIVTPRTSHAAIECGVHEGHPPVVLIPGFTGSKEDFIALLEPVAKAGFAVVAYDQRGQFQSPMGDATTSITLDSLADDLLALLTTTFPDQRVHLVGHSFGGLVARTAVLRDPDSFESLTLMCSGAGALPESAHPLLVTLEHALGAMPMEEVWRAKDELDRANDPTPPDPEIHEFLHQRFVANDPQALGSKAAILREEPDRSTRLGEVVKDRGIPVLVLYGEDDDAWPIADQQAMATTIGASVTVIARAGHSPAVDDPAATSAALVDFWSSSAEPSPHDSVWEVSTSTRMGISKA